MRRPSHPYPEAGASPRDWEHKSARAHADAAVTGKDTMAHVPLEARRLNTNQSLFRAQGAHCALLRPMDPGSKYGTRTTVCRLRHWRWSRSRGHTQSTWWRNRRGPSLPRGRADRVQGWRTVGSTSRPGLGTAKQGVAQGRAVEAAGAAGAREP